MKLIQRIPVICALILFSGMATAGSDSLSEFKSNVMPVLVQVNANGKVTGVSPAEQLSPALNRLLRANVDEMINAPAVDKNGRSMSSQFILNMVMSTTPRADGNYDANFAYASTVPVPAGSWYWVHTDGYRVALAQQAPGRSFRAGMRNESERVQPTYQHNINPPSMPPAAAVVRGSAPDPKKGQ